MMRKKVLAVTAVIAAISLALAACFVEYDPDDVPQGEPMGTYSGTAESEGSGYGGPVTVSLTLKGGYITDVQITGKGETADRGGQVIRQALNFIKKANSVEIDTVSGSTRTCNAIRTAGRKVLFIITEGEYGSEDGSEAGQ
jgi:major membrane immunogen (membrane-anchored lipoprotein)